MTSVRRETMELTDTRLLLNRLRIAAYSDGASPKSFALLLKKAFEERAWESEGFATFRAYMEAPEPDGLAMTEARLLDAARLAEVEPLARQLLLAEVDTGTTHRGRTVTERVTRDGTTNSNITRRNDVNYVVSRLKRDDPALAEKVVNGEVSAYAAARSKGWKPPRIQITNPERIADSLSRHLPREALTRLVERLIELLTKEDQ